MEDKVTPAAGRLMPGEADAAKREFAETGYVIFRNVVDRSRLAELSAALTREFETSSTSGTLFSGGGKFSGHLNCFPGKDSRFVYDTLETLGYVDLMKQLHPKVVRLPYVGCNFNLPGSHTQHYHIDRPFSQEFMIANVALVDTTVENGATEVIPGTHKRFYKYTRFVLERQFLKGVRVPLKQGDLMIRSSNVWHRGTTNHTRTPRPMMALTWEDGGSNEADPFGIHDGEIRFKPNWFKPTLAGRIREKIFVRVPLAYGALRFARSLVDSEY